MSVILTFELSRPAVAKCDDGVLWRKRYATLGQSFARLICRFWSRKKKICGAEQIAGTITYLMVQTPCLAMGLKGYFFNLLISQNGANSQEAVASYTDLAHSRAASRDPVVVCIQEARTDRNLKIYVYISNAA